MSATDSVVGATGQFILSYDTRCLEMTYNHDDDICSNLSLLTFLKG